MSNGSDDMDLDALISNPFQFLGAEEETQQAPQSPPGQGQAPPVRTPPPPVAGKREASPAEQVAAGMNIDRINRNHPLELRLLSAEKNQLRVFCPGASATVFIKTRINTNADEYKVFQAVMIMPNSSSVGALSGALVTGRVAG